MNRPAPNSNGFFNNYLEDLPIDIQKDIMAIANDGTIRSWKNYKSKDEWSKLQEVKQDEFSLSLFNEINKDVEPLNKYTKIGQTEEVDTYEEKLKKGKMKTIKTTTYVKPPIKYYYSFKYNKEEGRIYSKYRDIRRQATILEMEEDYDISEEKYGAITEAENTLGVSILFENMMKVEDGTKGYGVDRVVKTPAQPVPDNIDRMIWENEKERRLEMYQAKVKGIDLDIPMPNRYVNILKKYDEKYKDVPSNDKEVNTTYVRYVVDKNDKRRVALFNKYFPPI